MIVDHLEHLTTHRRTGFTLIEMMVVIGILAILGAAIVPGFKKIYGDYKIRETYDCIDTVLSAQRSFYQIFDEKPNLNKGPVCGTVEPRMAPFLPVSWVDTSFNSKSKGYSGPEVWGLKFYESIPYQFTNVKAGELKTMLYYNDRRIVGSGIPYYLDEFRNKYTEKGYLISEEGVDGYFQCIQITSQEYSNVAWFR